MIILSPRSTTKIPRRSPRLLNGAFFNFEGYAKAIAIIDLAPVITVADSFSSLYQALQIQIDNLIVVAGLSAALIPQKEKHSQSLFYLCQLFYYTQLHLALIVQNPLLIASSDESIPYVTTLLVSNSLLEYYYLLLFSHVIRFSNIKNAMPRLSRKRNTALITIYRKTFNKIWSG